MPQFEHGDVARVAETAVRVAAELRSRVDAGWTMLGLVPSCVLMLKFEWPLLAPDDDNVRALAAAPRDIDEYVVGLARGEGLADGLQPPDGGGTPHLACQTPEVRRGGKEGVRR